MDSYRVWLIDEWQQVTCKNYGHNSHPKKQPDELRSLF